MLISSKIYNGINGEIAIPGDKSISHRSIIIPSISNGVSEISNILKSEDVINTMNAFKLMGVKIEELKDKIIILVDDSLVRGNTIQSLSHMFYENGCKELHIRICSPELKFPCYYGIDIPTHEELIINNYTIPEIEKKFNLSSLRYITIEKMLEAFGKNNDFCCACFNGEYNKELDW